MRNKIVVVGSLNYDIILKVSRLPELGETMPANGAAFAAGGKGANQAVQAAKLGIDTYMVGAVGKDAHGDELLQTAKQYGVNTQYIKRVDEPTGLGVVDALDDGSVFATIVRGANFALTKRDIDEMEFLLKEAGVLILQMEIPQEINEYLIDKAKACGCIILLNAAPAAWISEKSLKKVDILVVNEVEAGFFLNKTINSVEKGMEGAKKLFQKYGCHAVVTMGKEGAAVCEDGVCTFVPSMEVPAIESTGAGDSFIGGIGYSIVSQNGIEDLVGACRFATKCSAVTVCRLGAQSAMPTLDEIK